MDVGFLWALDQELSYKVQGAEHTTVYKRGVWDGRKKLLTDRLFFPIGLLQRVMEFYENQNKPFELLDLREPKSKGKPINIIPTLKKMDKAPYPYQLEAVKAIHKIDRGIIRVATGGGKCNNVNSLHVTEHGLLDYSELIDDDLEKFHATKLNLSLATPLTKNGSDKTSMIYRDGKSKSIRIKTKYGYELTATPAHEIKVLDNQGNLSWRKMSNLKVNDFAAICYDTNVFGKKSMPLDEAYWYGLLIGDGGLSRKTGISFTNMDEHIIKFVKKYSKDKKLNLLTYQGKSKALDMRINSVKYRNYLKNVIGFDYKKATAKTIPQQLRMLNKECLAMVLRGIYETDGWVETKNSKPVICLGLSSKKIIDQIHLILLNFGIVASRRTRKTTHADSHLLVIYREFIQKFADEIGFDPKGRKYKNLKNYINNNNYKVNKNSNLIPNQNLKLKKLLDLIPRENREEFFKDMPISSHALSSWVGGRSWRSPSNQNLEKVLLWWRGKLKNNQEAKDIIDSILPLCKTFFLPIISIDKVVSDNYDFVIPKSNSFVSQGFINHNTLISALITAEIGKNTIIYVIGKDLLHQMHDFYSKAFPKLKIGKIGDGICEIGDINIASVWTIGQALGLRGAADRDDEKKIDKDKYSQIQEMLKLNKVHILDECHISSCSTIQGIAQEINPEHIYGMSASPWRDDNSDLLIECVLGKKIVDISASYLIENGYLVQPIIKFKSVPKYHEKIEKNYNTIYKKYIVENDVRNNLVVECAEELVNLGHQTLILYQSIAHGERLKELMEAKMPCVLLSGKDNTKIRDEAKQGLDSGEIRCILASKIFDIGVDFPSLSGLVIAGSGKSSVRALQRIGRVIRKHPGKKYAAVYDFADNAAYVKSHAEQRYQIYSMENKFKVSWPKTK